MRVLFPGSGWLSDRHGLALDLDKLTLRLQLFGSEQERRLLEAPCFLQESRLRIQLLRHAQRLFGL